MTPYQFRAARKACGMTMEEWFIAVGGPAEARGKKQAVYRWEEGERPIHPLYVEKARELWRAAAKKIADEANNG